MLLVVRHGSTHMNGEDEKMRGWLPIPLSKQGMMEVMHTAETIKNFNLDGIDKIYTSDLPRAVQTAQEIASELNKEIEPNESLRDWNVGKYTGKSVKQNLDEIHHYIDNPNESIPGGESYKEFFNRCYPFLSNLVKSDKLSLVITHNRVVTLIAALAADSGKHPDKAILKKKGPVEPAGIMTVDPDWSVSIVPDGKKSYV